ncbi:hypothetical protein CL633_02260 [bacterium]|nr:hypothetical protein [bacterium]|tara:strand:- start:9977 stop:10645 length:669 start_codon:yes stop_codon:yes gene_type:complete
MKWQQFTIKEEKIVRIDYRKKAQFLLTEEIAKLKNSFCEKVEIEIPKCVGQKSATAQTAREPGMIIRELLAELKLKGRLEIKLPRIVITGMDLYGIIMPSVSTTWPQESILGTCYMLQPEKILFVPGHHIAWVKDRLLLTGIFEQSKVAAEKYFRAKPFIQKGISFTQQLTIKDENGLEYSGVECPTILYWETGPGRDTAYGRFGLDKANSEKFYRFLAFQG